MRAALPTKNANVLGVYRLQPVAAVADDWELANSPELDDPEVLWQGRADCVLFQSEVIQSTGSEVNIISAKRMLLPAVCELKIDDRILVAQRGVADKTYRVTGLFLDTSDFHGTSIYSLTVSEVV